MRKVPAAGQRPVRLDCEDFTVQHAAPIAAKIETMADDRARHWNEKRDARPAAPRIPITGRDLSV